MSGRRIITAEESSLLLGITEATLKNWIRHGYLSPAPNATKNFYRSDILLLKKQLDSGRIDRLRQRANKTRLRRTAIPAEYVDDPAQVNQIKTIRALYNARNLDPARTMFVLAARLLVLKKEVRLQDAAGLFCAGSFPLWQRRFVKAEMLDWLRALDSRPAGREADYADLFCSLNRVSHEDLLGVLYQSLLGEGHRSGQGLYYTPDNLLAGLFEKRRAGGRFLDPCCGTGQFLIRAGRAGRFQPEELFGFDLDPTAVRIARINLLLTFPDQDFSPRIVCADFLNPAITRPYQQCFRLIATNPPWGAALRPAQLARLKKAYPLISSRESFAFFLTAGLELLEEGGRLSFILPESFLNIAAHRDIRSHLLSSFRLTDVAFLGRKFAGVLSRVIRIEVEKSAPAKNSRTRVKPAGGRSHTVSQSRFLKNDGRVIDAGMTAAEAAVIKKIYASPHVTLKGAADWAMGIVTGDNRRYLSPVRRKGMEAVFRGKDIEPYHLKEAGMFIRFTPARFQQTAPEHKYRARKKLVYRFISRRLVFALDNSGALTLNSANILIPKIADYPAKAVLGMLNSALCWFVFSRKFHTHRILRKDLEALPLPRLGEKRLDRLIKLVDRALAGEEVGAEIDDLLLAGLNLSARQKRLVLRNA